MLLSSFGRHCFLSPLHVARRSVPLTPRLEWQDERRSFCFPPPVGAGIHSRGVKGARPGAHQRTFSLSTRRTFSLSSDIPICRSAATNEALRRREIGTRTPLSSIATDA